MRPEVSDRAGRIEVSEAGRIRSLAATPGED
jgi:hypothetical protein